MGGAQQGVTREELVGVAHWVDHQATVLQFFIEADHSRFSEWA